MREEWTNATDTPEEVRASGWRKPCPDCGHDAHEGTHCSECNIAAVNGPCHSERFVPEPARTAGDPRVAALEAAVREADGFLTAGSAFNGHSSPDPIAAHITLDAALRGEWKPRAEPTAPPNPADACTCGHRRDHHTNRDVDDVVGWPCIDNAAALSEASSVREPEETK